MADVELEVVTEGICQSPGLKGKNLDNPEKSMLEDRT